MAQRVAAGKSHGRVAYGWRREYEHDASGRIVGSRDLIDPAAAQVVRQGAQRVLAGESLRSITRHLTEIGAPTATGTPWDSTALRGILLRQRNVGLRTHQGHVVGRGDWEPILDEATFERVTAILTDPARRNSPASSAVKYLLSGIARCGLCGGPMRVLLPGQGHKQDSYVCQDKYHVRRMRQPLDDFITEVVVARLSRPDAVDLLAQPDNDDAHKAREQAGALRARLDLAADAFAAGDIDARQLARITARLRPELDQYEQIARSLSTAPDLVDLATPDIAERWTDLPLDRRRAVIDTLMMIRVLPTRRGGLPRFDPASLRIEWKASYRSEP